jgi:inosine-uridine nucleoside N-ribohydrolase
MKTATALFLAIVTSGFVATVEGGAEAAERIPVIYDTDIGDDIDDTWALVMLLKSPQLDLKMISTTSYNARARARLIAKLLTVAGRSDIPIALGRDSGGKTRQDAWSDGFSLEDYAGVVYEDGPQAIIDLVNDSERPLTIIAVGPLQTLDDVLERDPAIASRAHLVGMYGSVYKGYGGSTEVSQEYNVLQNLGAARRVLLASWRSTTLTPLDTCGVVKLEGNRFRALQQSGDPLVEALLENYRVWTKGWAGASTRSSTLYDTVAVYLGYPGPKGLIDLEDLPISVTDDGYTRVDSEGARMEVATSWNDLDGYLDLLVEVLNAPVQAH